MISIKTRAYIGLDGVLKVKVPTPLSDTDVEVILILQPLLASKLMPESLDAAGIEHAE